MRNVIRYGLILMIITVVSAVLLSTAKQLTYPAIQANKEAAKAKAIAELLDVSDVEIIENDIAGINPDIDSIFTAQKDGEAAGFVFGVSPKGYGGDIEMLVAIDADGVIKGFSIIKHNETPGLGANAEKPTFANQFPGKTGRLSVTRTNPSANEIQAITSATVTSKAVVNGVNTALEFFNLYKEELN